ncbi:MAG: hypothetical protein GX197_06180 [Firmicutes bacterium]|nr:hypothetical protein [Bacillota bacterium]
MSNHDIPVKELTEMLEMATEKVPKLINAVLQSVYSQETGAEMGKAAGAFYKELIAAGVPKEDALTMTQDYLKTLRNLAPSAIKVDH